MEKISVTKYKAFDGRIFETLNDCEAYERVVVEKKIETFKNFPIAFPMQDRVTDCTAYLISSENDFNALREYIDWNFPEVYAADIDYEGNGWYVIQDDHCGYATVDKLSDVIHSWSVTLDEIAKHTMDFKEE